MLPDQRVGRVPIQIRSVGSQPDRGTAEHGHACQQLQAKAALRREPVKLGEGPDLLPEDSIESVQGSPREAMRSMKALTPKLAMINRDCRAAPSPKLRTAGHCWPAVQLQRYQSRFALSSCKSPDTRSFHSAGNSTT